MFGTRRVRGEPFGSEQHRGAAVSGHHEAFGDIFKAAIGMEGTITGEHGVGAAKLPYLTDRLGADQMALLRRIKAAFDPAGILNPGKLGS
jgi:glycolate oxidase